MTFFNEYPTLLILKNHFLEGKRYFHIPICYLQTSLFIPINFNVIRFLLNRNRLNSFEFSLL